jgi:hypothetical protein
MSRGRPFEPGNSLGRGRPKGSRNKSTEATMALLGEHAEMLMKKCIAEALKGNMIAMRLCIERILPALQEGTIKFKLGATRTSQEVGQAQDTILKEVSKGRIVPEQGAVVVNMLEGKRKTLETTGVEERLYLLESQSANDSEPDTGKIILLEKDAA